MTIQVSNENDDLIINKANKKCMNKTLLISSIIFISLISITVVTFFFGYNGVDIINLTKIYEKSDYCVNTAQYISFNYSCNYVICLNDVISYNFFNIY